MFPSNGEFVLNCGRVRRCGALRVLDQVSRYEREKDIRFRVDSEDYFGTLATIVDLFLQKEKRMDTAARKVLEDIRDDLLFLEAHYKISSKQ